MSHDRRLIEAGFPCHQVGAETQRERGASSALPPLYFLHIWWARRPLTPSRAAIVASLDPEGTDPDTFVRRLGIEKRVVMVGGRQWTLTGKLLDRIETDHGAERIKVDRVLLRAFESEQKQRRENLELIARLKAKDLDLAGDPVVIRWERESQPLPADILHEGDTLDVARVMGGSGVGQGEDYIRKQSRDQDCTKQIWLWKSVPNGNGLQTYGQSRSGPHRWWGFHPV